MNKSDKPLVTSGQAIYGLIILFIVYNFKMMDRLIFSIVQNSVAKELSLTDQQLGVLGGIAFAILYAILGLPVARLADRKSRVWIITIGVAFWSVLTAVCGMVQNFIQFAFARVGVGIGEAFATPASHSMISDYFPPEKRGKMLGIYSAGGMTGMLLGSIVGAMLASKFGWRYAFFALGIPGIILAVITKLTVKEPPRGVSDKVEKIEDVSYGDVVKYLFSKKSFRHICAAGAIAGMTGWGIMHFMPVFMARVHGMKMMEFGMYQGISFGFIGGISIIVGGILADRLSKRSKKWIMWVALAGLLLYFPFINLTILAPSKGLMIVALFLAALVGQLYMAPIFTSVQNLSKVNMRALAAAIYLLINNLIGSGIGPWLTGILSDALKPSYGDESIRYACVIMTVGLLWAAVHVVLASRTLKEDFEKALE